MWYTVSHATRLPARGCSTLERREDSSRRGSTNTSAMLGPATLPNLQEPTSTSRATHFQTWRQWSWTSAEWTPPPPENSGRATSSTSSGCGSTEWTKEDSLVYANCISFFKICFGFTFVLYSYSPFKPILTLWPRLLSLPQNTYPRPPPPLYPSSHSFWFFTINFP